MRWLGYHGKGQSLRANATAAWCKAGERVERRSAHPNMRAMLGWSVGKSRLNDRRPPTARLSQACTSKTVYNQLPAHPRPTLTSPSGRSSLELICSVAHATSPPRLLSYFSIPLWSVCLLRLLFCRMVNNSSLHCTSRARPGSPLPAALPSNTRKGQQNGKELAFYLAHSPTPPWPDAVHPLSCRDTRIHATGLLYTASHAGSLPRSSF